MKTMNQYIDHTVLKPEATNADILTLCDEAVAHGFYAVCVNSSYVKTCKDVLGKTDIKIASVVGFPLGAMHTEAKVAETTIAVADGADEIDMVLMVGKLKEKNDREVKQDIQAVVQAAALGGARVKVILETCLLTDEEIVRACRIAKDAGAAFVKTSTGFSTGGATAHHVRLMRETVGDSLGVKASGGIRNRKKALEMIQAGADRIGASASISICAPHDISR